MKAFTDDDLKRRKEFLCLDVDPQSSLDEERALIARLECAEAYAASCPSPFGVSLFRLRDDWLSSKGEGGGE